MQCHRTHDSRIKCHNALVQYIANRLELQGYNVEREPEFATRDGLRKPDLLATRENLAIIIDGQVRGDQVDLTRAHNDKVAKYQQYPEIQDQITKSSGATRFLFVAATLSWRGVWAKPSAQVLQGLGTLNRRDLAIISSRVLVGGVASWNIFNRRTDVRGGR